MRPKRSKKEAGEKRKAAKAKILRLAGKTKEKYAKDGPLVQCCDHSTIRRISVPALRLGLGKSAVECLIIAWRTWRVREATDARLTEQIRTANNNKVRQNLKRCKKVIVVGGKINLANAVGLPLAIPCSLDS